MSYQCEYCSSQYGSHEDAERCEKTHAPADPAAEAWFYWLRRDELGEWRLETYPLWYREAQLLIQHPELQKPAVSVCGDGKYVSVTCERLGPRDETMKGAERDLVRHMRDWLATCAADLDSAYPPDFDGGDAPG